MKFSVYSEKEHVLHGGVIWLSTGRISVTHIRRQAERSIGRRTHTWLYGLTMDYLQFELNQHIFVWLLRVVVFGFWYEIDRDIY